MPRPRKLRKDLPPRLYCEDGIYFFRPKSGKRITFGSDERVARAEYWKLVGRHTDKRTLGPIMDAWLEEHAADIRLRTFDDYKACIANLKAHSVTCIQMMSRRQICTTTIAPAA
jgi:hypothetical protein